MAEVVVSVSVNVVQFLDRVVDIAGMLQRQVRTVPNCAQTVKAPLVRFLQWHGHGWFCWPCGSRCVPFNVGIHAGRYAVTRRTILRISHVNVDSDPVVALLTDIISTCP